MRCVLHALLLTSFTVSGLTDFIFGSLRCSFWRALTENPPPPVNFGVSLEWHINLARWGLERVLRVMRHFPVESMYLLSTAEGHVASTNREEYTTCDHSVGLALMRWS